MNDAPNGALALHEPTKPLAVAEAQPGTILAAIIRMSSDPALDIEKFQALLAVQERMEAREAEIAFNEAMRSVQEELKPIAKRGKNETTRSSYARLDDVIAALNPTITKHGFAESFGSDVSPIPNHYRVTCRLSHVMGHHRDYQVDVPSDLVGMKGAPNKTPTHAFGSTMSYGRRYLKFLIWDVATGDDNDGNAAGVEPISAEQIEELRRGCKETGSAEDHFLNYLGYADFADIRARDLAKARNALENKRRKLREGAFSENH